MKKKNKYGSQKERTLRKALQEVASKLGTTQNTVIEQLKDQDCSPETEAELEAALEGTYYKSFAAFRRDLNAG